MRTIRKPIEFVWDKGNIVKNTKHFVTDQESEEIFNNKKQYITKDKKHSQNEERYMLWGETKARRKLTVFFTLRKNKVRIISARDMSHKERKAYEKKIQSNTKV